MIVASHQPHYFPWIGYFDKMAKANIFLLNDEVQLEKKSPMVRNKFLDSKGDEVFLTISIEKEGLFNLPNKDIRINKNMESIKKHEKFFVYNYKKAPYFEEVWDKIGYIFMQDYEFLIDIQKNTIFTIAKLLDINTPIVLHSTLEYDRSKTKNELIIEKCKAVKASIYLSGNGAKKYMDVDLFNHNGIEVVYQDFIYPKYLQYNHEEFIPNLSTLDLLFNMGIEKSTEIFWENVNSTNEINR